MDPVFAPPGNNPAFTRFSLNQAMRRGWFIFKRQPMLFLLLCAVTNIPSLFEIILVEEESADARLLTMAEFLLDPFVRTGGCAYVVANLRRNASFSFGDDVGEWVGRFPALLPLAIIDVALGMGMLWCRSLPWFAIVGIFACTVVASTRFPFAVYACVAEKLGPWASLRRSWNLTAGHFWQMVGMGLYWLGSYAAVLVIVILYGAGEALATGKAEWSVADRVLLLCLSLVPTSVFTVCYAAVFFDLRREKEGETMEGMRKVFD